MKLSATCLLLIACLSCNAASAQIVASVGANATGVQTNFEDFESTASWSSPSSPFSSPGGFDFDLPAGSNNFVVWNNGLGFASNSLYQNGGATDVTSIELTSLSDIDGLEFDFGNGWDAGLQEILIRAYDNGVFTGFEFNFFSIPIGSRMTVQSMGTSFDEIRVQAFYDGYGHASGSETQYGAITIDNVAAFMAIPEPTSIGLLSAIGGIGLMFTRRRKNS